MTQRDPRQFSAFAAFDSAPPIRVKLPPAGLGWCAHCAGRGHVAGERCEPCNGGGFVLLDNAIPEELPS